MDKNEKILLKFVLYFLTLLLIIIIGISNVFASEYNFDYSYIQSYYDNYGSSLIAVNSTWNQSLQAYVSDNIGTTANSYGAGVAFNSPIPLLAGHTYTMSLSFLDKNNISLSSKNYISVGNSAYESSIGRYPSGNYHASTDYSSVSNNSILSFAFTVDDNSSYIFVPYTTTYNTSQNYVFTSIVIDDLGAGGISQNDINNSLNNQTNIINNSISSSTNTIVDNSNQNRQAIIDNQNSNNDALIQNDNANTDRIIDENKKNFNDCRDSVNLLNINRETGLPSNTNFSNTTKRTFDFTKKILGITANNYYVDTNISSLTVEAGKATFQTSSGGYGVGFPIKLQVGGTYTISANISDTSVDSLIRVSYYKEDGTFISFNSSSGTRNYLTFTVPNETYYTLIILTPKTNTLVTYSNIQLQLGSSATDYEQYGQEICVNKLDEQTNAINGLNDSLTDSSSIDMGSLSDSAGWLPAGPIDSIINLPLNFFNSLLNALNRTCSPLSVPLPYINQTLEIPCISTIFNNITGVSTFWNWVGTIASVVILYRYLLSLYKYYDDLTTLKANFISDFGGAP